MLYEGVLLFAILFIAEWLFATLLQQRDPALFRAAMECWLFMVVGIYFVWCWINGGQTLPMKTWHMRVVSRDGSRLTPRRAVLRYLAAWLMFVPGLLLWTLAPVPLLFVLPLINFILWMSAAIFDKDRQFPHDRLAGTRMILVAKSDTKAPKSS